MIFNSFQFLIFFLVVSTIFYTIPFKWRWLLLLLASCYFYMVYIPVYILILAFTIVIDYFIGIHLERVSGARKKLFLILSILSNIGILAFFKYYNFFAENVSSLFNVMGYKSRILSFSLLLPIGLSFHTFQALSYIIEVYKGNQKAERHFGIYALYVMFFPQLVAGPIERPQNILYQFYENRKFDIDNITDGLKLMLRGFFKKLVVADRLAIYVNTVYNHSISYSGLTLFIATLFFAFQIYCDFSGYSDIAIGAAKILGFKLVTNFNNPYLARNISEFWKRWHISLTSWFKDYLYIPMGGNRSKPLSVSFNLLFVFTISGLWHGASWNFVLWGMINGTFLICLRLTRRFWPHFYRVTNLDKFPWLKIPLQMIVTMLFVSVSWIFFRANNVTEVFAIITKIVSFRGDVFFGGYTIYYCILGIAILLLYEIKTEYFNNNIYLFNNSSYLVRNFSYAFVIIFIIMFGVFDGGQFIYFQF